MGTLNPYTSYLTLTGGITNWTVTNVGVAGEFLSTMLANAPASVDTRFNPAIANNIVVIWGGSNDIANAHQPVDVYANMVSYVAARHAKGWKVIVVTMIARVGWDQKKNALNALIIANTAGADAIVDMSNTPIGVDSGYLSTRWFNPDEIHPVTDAVVIYEAPMISAGINSVLV